MMAAKSSLLRFYGYVIVGLIMVRLNAAKFNNTTTPMPTTPTTPPLTPLTGYGHFNVTNKDGICLLLDLSCSVTAQLQVNSTERPATYNLPLKAQASGSCGDETSSVSLSWKLTSTEVTADLTLSMAFMKVDEKWKTTSLAFTAKTTNNRTVSAVQNDSSKLTITANRENSYKCSESMDFDLSGDVKVIVTVNKIQVQPFGKDFGDADVCFSSSYGNTVDTVVPTAVGCVLAGLIVILIITYFVGRCKRPGYEKM